MVVAVERVQRQLESGFLMDLLQTRQIEVVEGVFRTLSREFREHETVVVDKAVEPTERLFVPHQFEFLGIDSVRSHHRRRDRIHLLRQFDFRREVPAVHLRRDSVDFYRMPRFGYPLYRDFQALCAFRSVMPVQDRALTMTGDFDHSIFSLDITFLSITLCSPARKLIRSSPDADG